MTPDIGYLLNRAARALRLRLAEALDETGLTPPQAAALMAVARADGGALTPSSLAWAIDTDQATVTGLVDRLVRGGWVTVGPNPDDGRSRLVRLTGQGEAALPKVIAAAHAVSVEATLGLTADEASTLAALLERVGVATTAPTASKTGEAR